VHESASRLLIVDALRGIAALFVCWHHFTHGSGPLGVEIFFVISGFVIPYALHQSGYALHYYGRFILKRLIRLDPPYLISIALIVPLAYFAAITPGYKGPPFDVSFLQVALHLAYLNAFFDLPWLNGVFWTLAIEFQYYLLAGLAYPLIASQNRVTRILAFCLGAALAVSSSNRQLVTYWLFVFMLGMSAFQYRCHLIDRRWFLALSVIFGAGVWAVHGLPIAIVSVAATGMIALANFKIGQPLLFLGAISYSLYLLHAPIGGRLVNLGRRFVDSIWGDVFVLIFALVTMLIVSWAFYRLVERPALKWSSRIRYRASSRRPSTSLEALECRANS
jgi:peptidoglycan/LPS O-acetylase OafA/YrhL